MTSNSMRVRSGIASANTEADGTIYAIAAEELGAVSPDLVGGRRCASEDAREQAAANLAYLFCKLARLYTCGDASSLSRLEATQLARSLEFTLGLKGDGLDEALDSLAHTDPEELFTVKQRELARRVDAALETWAQIIALMPPLRNIALRDTLASIGQLKARYDIYFAAHEVPCEIDYQLSRPIDVALEGIDYIEAYLDQLLAETRWIARFTPASCIAALERICPDYRGLHVNLVDLLEPHEAELQPSARHNITSTLSHQPQQSGPAGGHSVRNPLIFPCPWRL